jgi:hypothetical protein
VQNYPLIRNQPSKESIRRYTSEALRIVDRTERLVASVHDRGVVFGDLHPDNIVLRPDGTVGLVDFELSFAVAEDRKPALGAAGFAAPRHKRGFDIDRHALAALRLWVFQPLTTLLDYLPGKVDDFVAMIGTYFDLPEAYGASITAELGQAKEKGAGTVARPGGEIDADELDWPALRDSMTEAIRLSATPERADRLFPGDIAQFTHGGAGIAFGAAGVLYALLVAGADPSPRHEEWLLNAAAADHGGRAGLYDGHHGVAYVLDRLGHHEAALDTLDHGARLTKSLQGAALFDGLAGVGLTSLHFAERTGDSGFLDQATEIAGRLADRVRTDRLPGSRTALDPRDGDTRETDVVPGLMHGWSGLALFFARLYERTSDRGCLDVAVQALHRDLAACIEMADGSLQAREYDRRALPYLAVGSAGIAMVIDTVLTHRPDARLTEAMPRLVDACSAGFVAQAGLFNGRAGLVATLASLTAKNQGSGPDVLAHLRRLSWHAVSYRGRLAFPGDQNLRLSMDLATGSAGVLAAVNTVLNHTEFLPFLGSR